MGEKWDLQENHKGGRWELQYRLKEYASRIKTVKHIFIVDRVGDEGNHINPLLYDSSSHDKVS